MTTIVKELKNIRPPLKWEPVQGPETTDFLDRKHTISKIPKDALQSVVFEAQQVLGRCVSPKEPPSGSTGLVVGYVQSGKTISFTTLTALAHDNGFGLVILIAGTLQNLLVQTKKRIEEDLLLSGTGSRPWLIIDSPSPGKPEAIALESHLKHWSNPNFPAHKRRVCFVIILKQHKRISNLVKCLKGIDLTSTPTLVIDDESDQATPNIHAAKNKVTGGQRKSSNYGEVLLLKSVLPHHTYVEYTATPQANLLAALDDELSPEFGEILRPGAGYVGGATLFKPHSKYAVTIPDSEASATPSTTSGPPNSLVKAIRLFLLGACAAEYHRAGMPRTMMVHPSQQTGPHNHYLQWIAILIEEWNSISEKPDIAEDFFASFTSTYSDLKATVGNDLPSFPSLIEHLPLVLSLVQVREVNSTGTGYAPINWNACDYWILVGGAKLDRGFTVEGLTVTYMTRPLATGNADSLQQRARFYGYKQKYLGYCRVFVRDDVRVAFEQYVEHETEIHRCLDAHRGLPLKAWVRQFTLHPSMQPTRKGVIGIDLADYESFGWSHPSAAHIANVERNKTLFSEFIAKLESNFPGDCAHKLHPQLFIDKRSNSAPNMLYEAVPLRVALELFLRPFELSSAKDFDEWSALVYALTRLEYDSTQVVDVFLMGSIAQTRSVTEANLIKEIFSGKAPSGKVSREKLNYGGDRDFIAPERITIHLRKFNLRSSPDAAPFILDVPWYAVHIPESLSSRHLVQTE